MALIVSEISFKVKSMVSVQEVLSLSFVCFSVNPTLLQNKLSYKCFPYRFNPKYTKACHPIYPTQHLPKLSVFSQGQEQDSRIIF